MKENSPSLTTSKIPAWSWTSYSAYQTCPFRYKVTRVTKEIVEPETEVLRWGKLAHKALEDRVKEGVALPEGMEKWEKYARFADKTRAFATLETEQQIALDKDLKPVDYWSKDAWVRGVLDLSMVGKKVVGIWDYKTGKIRDSSDQLKLFAGFAFSKYPEIEEVHTQYVWLNHDKITGNNYNKGDVPMIWETFQPTVDRLTDSYEENNWPTKTSGLCRAHCPVPKSLCKHSGLTR